MTISGNLLAWVEARGANVFVGAFVGEGALPDNQRQIPGRSPAMRVCASAEEARRWVEDQAASLALPIKWVSEAPYR